MIPGVLLLNLHYNLEPHVVVINFLVVTGPEMKMQIGMMGSTANAPSSIAYPFQNIYVECSYECTPNRADVFERYITLPDCSVMSQAVPMPCKLQECNAR